MEERKGNRAEHKVTCKKCKYDKAHYISSKVGFLVNDVTYKCAKCHFKFNIYEW